MATFLASFGQDRRYCGKVSVLFGTRTVWINPVQTFSTNKRRQQFVFLTTTPKNRKRHAFFYLTLKSVVLNLGATAPYGALLTFRGAEILRGAL